VRYSLDSIVSSRPCETDITRTIILKGFAAHERLARHFTALERPATPSMISAISLLYEVKTFAVCSVSSGENPVNRTETSDVSWSEVLRESRKVSAKPVTRLHQPPLPFNRE
jgi:hypothetical protein